MKYKVLDLFAGAGGLSLGFSQTGRFDIVAAYENNLSAQLTYSKNFPQTVIRGDILDANFSEIKKTFGNIDVIIGGPPCQGFSNANRQHNQLINMNNALVKSYIKFVEVLRPKAFLMENVKMLSSETHRFFYCASDSSDILDSVHTQKNKQTIYEGIEPFPLNKLIVGKDNSIVSSCKLCSQQECLFLKHIANNERERKNKGRQLARFLCSLQESVNLIENAELNASMNEFIIRVQENCTDSKIMTIDASVALRNLYYAVQAMRRLEDLKANGIYIDGTLQEGNSFSVILISFSVFDYLDYHLGSLYSCTSKIVNAAEYGVPQIRKRFVYLGLRKDYSKNVPTIHLPLITPTDFAIVKDAIGDLEGFEPLTKNEIDNGIILEKKQLEKLIILRDSSKVYNHISTNTGAMALSRFKEIKQGQNFHSLSVEMKKGYAKPERTQNTIYRRLEWGKPSPTVTNVRKAMWIHPNFNRAISVREAARLQSFPDSFRFYGTKDKQYQQVGNAVPPMLAKALAEEIIFNLNLDKK